MRIATAAVVSLALALPARADVVVLLNGDRITGRVTGSVTRRVRLQTPYGVLVIPAAQVERIRRDDGREEVLNAPPAPKAKPTPPPATALELVLGGASFWQAWDPKHAPLDPSLRLEVQLDERPIATYTDVNLDPEDLPKAVVNSFVFAPDRIFVRGADGFTVAPPSLAEGEIRLRVELPDALAGEHRLRLAYQLNDASSSAPRWRDAVVAGASVVLEAGHTLRVDVLQDRGTMEYARQGFRGPSQMRGVETFRATLTPAAAP